MTGNNIWPRNTKILALGPTLGRSAEHVSCSTRGDCPRLSQLGLGDAHRTLSGDQKSRATPIEEDNSTNSPRKARGASKVDVDDKGKDYTEKIRNTLFREKLPLQGAEQPLYLNRFVQIHSLTLSRSQCGSFFFLFRILHWIPRVQFA